MLTLDVQNYENAMQSSHQASASGFESVTIQGQVR